MLCLTTKQFCTWLQNNFVFDYKTTFQKQLEPRWCSCFQGEQQGSPISDKASIRCPSCVCVLCCRSHCQVGDFSGGVQEVSDEPWKGQEAQGSRGAGRIHQRCGCVVQCHEWAQGCLHSGVEADQVFFGEQALKGDCSMFTAGLFEQCGLQLWAPGLGKLLVQHFMSWQHCSLHGVSTSKNIRVCALTCLCPALQNNWLQSHVFWWVMCC